MDATKKRKTEENGVPADYPPLTLTSEDAQKVLQSLTNNQLIDILQSAIIRHPDVLAAVRSTSDGDTTRRKLFVRGLSGDTTSETLRSVFSLFGDLEEAIVIPDKSTGKSKGYGFVTFKHVDGALAALREPSKKIDGRITVAQLAAAGKSENLGGNTGIANDVSTRKIYVGNVPFEISSERLLEYFMRYGEIEEGPLGFDKSTGKPNGFAFFVYKTEEGARGAILEPFKSIDGHQVMCKLAVDNKKTKPKEGPGGDGLQPPYQANSMPGSLYGVSVGRPSYHSAPAVPISNYGFNSAMPSAVGGPGNQMMPSMNSVTGFGGGYGGSQFGGLGLSEYGGMNSVGSYGLSSPAFSTQQTQQHQLHRLPPGGMYQGAPPYF